MKRPLWRLTGKAIIIILSLIAYGYIGHKLWHFTHWGQLFSSIQLSKTTVGLACLLPVLWWINLISETKKWQVLMAPFTKLSIRRAWQQVMAGTTTAVGSPSRIAEMGGRMALLPSELRVNAAIMTTLGGLLQNTVIILGGILTLLINGETAQLNLPLSYSFITIISLVLLLSVGTIAYAYSEKLRFYLRSLKNIQTTTLLNALIWTVIRYTIYIIQLYAWMRLFGLHLTPAEYLTLAPLYFLIITIIPSHVLIDLGIRGSVAIYLFSTLDIESPLILAATFCLWLSNVMLPTFIGSYVLIRQTMIKQAVIKKEV